MDFEDPLLTGLGISVDFLVVFLLNELVSVVVQCFDEAIHCRRRWYLRDHGRMTKRDPYGVAQCRYCCDKKTAKWNTSHGDNSSFIA